MNTSHSQFRAPQPSHWPDTNQLHTDDPLRLDRGARAATLSRPTGEGLGVRVHGDVSNSGQLELTLPPGNSTCPHRQQSPRRITRAAWWFTQMRQTVDRVSAWNDQPAPSH